MGHSSISDLRTALSYLTGLAIAEAENQSASIRRNPYLWEGSSSRNSSLEDIAEILSLILAASIVEILGVSRVLGNVKDFEFLLIIPMIFLLLRFFLDLILDRTVFSQPITVEGLRSDRLTILAVLSDSSVDMRAGGGSESQKEEEYEVDSALPAPPGITEIVLEAAPSDVFKDIRTHLLQVRRYHNIVLWALILAFMTFFGVSIWKLIVSNKSIGDYVQAFGSAGVGGMLFWFGQRTLWAQRVSQLSLALFESYVVEVGESLREIPVDITPAERRKIRSDIWRGFRNGLNQLWLDEKSHLEKQVGSSKRNVKDNS